MELGTKMTSFRYEADSTFLSRQDTKYIYLPDPRRCFYTWVMAFISALHVQDGRKLSHTCAARHCSISVKLNCYMEYGRFYIICLSIFFQRMKLFYPRTYLSPTVGSYRNKYDRSPYRYLNVNLAQYSSGNHSSPTPQYDLRKESFDENENTYDFSVPNICLF